MKKSIWINLKRGLLFLIVFSMVLILFSGCVVEKKETKDTGDKTTGSVTESTKETKPLEITVMCDYSSVEAPEPETPNFVELQKRLNVKFNVSWIPSSVWNERLSITLASGKLPKVLYMNKDSNIIAAARYGAFWDLTPYIPKYEFLSEIPKVTIEADSIDGKYFAVSRLRDLARTAFIYREDWLKTLGIKKPDTLDGFYEMLKAFTFNDPDKNGKDDTIGFIHDARLWIVEELAIMLGAPNFFGVDSNGKIYAHIDTPEYFEALKFAKKLYQDKIMNQDFAILTSAMVDSQFYTGMCGCYHGAVESWYGGQLEIRKIFPDAKLDCIVRIEKDRTRAWNAGSLGMFGFPKSSVKTEDELKQILSVYNKMMRGPELQTLIQYGVENIDYKVVNGYVEPIPVEQRQYKRGAGLNLLVCGKAVDPHLPLKIADPDQAEANEKIKKYLKINEKNAVMNYSLPFTSDTWALKGGDLNQLRKDAKIKYVMGEIDDSGWKAFLEQWHKEGGDQVIAEYQKQYDLTKAK